MTCRRRRCVSCVTLALAVTACGASGGATATAKPGVANAASVTAPAASPQQPGDHTHATGTSIVVSQRSGPRPQRLLVLAKPSGNGVVTSRLVHDAKGTDRTVWIYTPPVRAPAQLPVVYFLHGYPGAAKDALDAGFAGVLDAAFAAGVTPFMAVFPDGNGSPFDDNEWANSADGKQDLDTFLSTTLIQAVEGNRIRPRVRRAIAGFSMGGYGALNLATRHPAQYGEAVSMAGYFKVDDPDGVFNDSPLVKVANSPDHQVSALARTRVALFQGQLDGSSPEEGELERFAGLLDAAHIDHLAIRTPGDHSWSWAADQVGTMATFLAQGWLTG